MVEDRLRILTSKPYISMTDIERSELMKLIEIMLQKGIMVVLGEKRCFFCGDELGKLSGEYKTLNNKPSKNLLITNLCDKCYRLKVE